MIFLNFSGLATGGNVSAAMAIAGEKATYETFLTFTNQLVLLGRNTFHVLMIRTWSERIEYLVKANNYLDCITLGRAKLAHRNLLNFFSKIFKTNE